MLITVSAQTLEMPEQCACCGSDVSLGATAAAPDSPAFPYCMPCREHIRDYPEISPVMALLLGVVTLGLLLLYYWQRRYVARDGRGPWCTGSGPAVRLRGSDGHRHSYEFSSRSFARAFVERNRGRIVSADVEARVLIDELDAARGRPVQRRAAEPIAYSSVGTAVAANRDDIRVAPAPRAEASAAPSVSFSVRPEPNAPAVSRGVNGRASSEPAARARVFLGPGTRTHVAGRLLESPLIYVAVNPEGADASTVITSLPVGRADQAAPLPYWPNYFEASPDQRARYLDWLASGRTRTDVEIGYPFIFFYGLERRALVESTDQEMIAQEVLRMIRARAATSGSFAGYGTSFLAFLTLKQIDAIVEAALHERVGEFAASHLDARNVLLAWYALRGRPLPARYAAVVARSMEDAKAGVVVDRAAAELANLFEIRYRERFADGLVPVVAKRNAVFEYHPASASLAWTGARPTAPLPNVLGRPSQFNPLVELWNSCIDDLKKVSSAKRRSGDGTLTAAAWAALPPELRRECEHPDQGRWDEAVRQAPKAGRFHVMTASQLRTLSGISEGQKVTSAQLRKIGDTAADVGFAVEPEPRLLGSSVVGEAEFAVWRSAETTSPERETYHAASGLLSLGLSVASADGEASDEELNVITDVLREIVPVDEVLRARLEALRTVLIRQPARAAAVARKLRDTRSAADRAKVGRVLVLVAAADGALAPGEHKALRTIFRALGLSAGELDATLVACNLRLASDAPVLVDQGTPAGSGEAIPAPPESRVAARVGVALNAQAIASVSVRWNAPR